MCVKIKEKYNKKIKIQKLKRQVLETINNLWIRLDKLHKDKS